ncbi:MAG: calcium/sodium antiporter [Myxococcota bacterium]
MFLLSLLIGLVMLVAGAELLVRGGGNVALALRIPALVVGLTIVAFGTSAPELTVSVMAAVQASTEMAISNVNGSNIANIAFVLGLAAIVTPLVVERSLIRREVPVLVGVQILVPLLSLDGWFSRVDGIIVFAVGIAYNLWLIYDVYKGRAPPLDDELEVREDEPFWKHALMLLVGLVVLVIGADLFVDAAVQLATKLELSQRFIGLTVVALGTSAPETATAVMAARKGEVELAVGNSVGSNILNICVVLGITAMITPIEVSAPGFMRDMLIAVVAVTIIVPVVLRGSLSRAEGAVLVTGYVGYLVWGYLAGG